jgi:hypothetical protein
VRARAFPFSLLSRFLCPFPRTECSALSPGTAWRARPGRGGCVCVCVCVVVVAGESEVWFQKVEGRNREG